MYHTSPSKIEVNTITSNGIAGSCLFFSDDIYSMSESSIYVYEAEFKCTDVSSLYDEAIIARISEFFNVDFEVAENLLDGTANEWDYGAEGDDSWWLQGVRGECAVKMGFDGCKDNDEQGSVYIIPMLGRETEIKLIEMK